LNILVSKIVIRAGIMNKVAKPENAIILARKTPTVL
jgi:hypothetical protein